MIGKLFLTVIAAGLLSAIFSHLPVSRRRGELLKFLCGVFLLLTILKPLRDISMPDFQDYLDPISQEAQQAAAQGTELYENALREGIASRCSAYILEQAASLTDNHIEVEVTLSDTSPPVPIAVRVTGNMSTETWESLSNWTERNLNIPREKQVWICKN